MANYFDYFGLNSAADSFESLNGKYILCYTYIHIYIYIS